MDLSGIQVSNSWRCPKSSERSGRGS